ncbi:unnamed protein product [Pocillopora meandrina]|uniref:Uncharacterized protein n=1 Tax=Pocillopora meandrina TaxID=46732 RepID=A0AAU9X035_9CNID|nr:unnamed protein product [Pocillopora meandrina]
MSTKMFDRCGPKLIDPVEVHGVSQETCPSLKSAKYSHYNSRRINSGRKPSRLTNKLKAGIRRAHETFTRQALSSYNPKEEWRIIHHILKPNQQPLQQDPDTLNSFFACTAERTLPVSSDLPSCLEELIESLRDDSPANFKL